MAMQIAEARQDFTVPSASGSYAFQRITFGMPSNSTTPATPLQGVTVSVDVSVASSSVEVWLPRVGGGTKSPSAFVDTDFQYSGYSIAASGALTMPLAGYRGCQIRVKSGGTGGTATIAASCF